MSHSIPKQNSALELAKSVLVIPVVVAIVMGIGYALARVAERKEIASGKTDVRPTDTAADGSINLPVRFAVVTGQISRNGSGIKNWRHLEDFVLFHFPVEKPGHYAVELTYACDSANAGSTVQVQIGNLGDSIFTVADTGGSANYKSFRVGETVLLDDHWYNLRISATKIAHDTVMNLRAVKLIPN